MSLGMPTFMVPCLESTSTIAPSYATSLWYSYKSQVADRTSKTATRQIVIVKAIYMNRSSKATWLNESKMNEPPSNHATSHLSLLRLLQRK